MIKIDKMIDIYEEIPHQGINEESNSTGIRGRITIRFFCSRNPGRDEARRGKEVWIIFRL
jgi:hypothetical protein